MQLLAPDSPLRDRAHAFGVELQRAMVKRGVLNHHINRAIGLAASGTTIDAWKTGAAIPRLDTALKIAEFLDWSRLADLIRQLRTFTCARPTCGRQFLTEWGNTAKPRYCSRRCYELVRKYRRFPLKDKTWAEKRRARVVMLHRAERELASVQEEVAEVRRAVAAMCKDCEPAGYCRTPDCPLRLVSPLPLSMPRIGDHKTPRFIQVREAARAACKPGCRCARHRRRPNGGRGALRAAG